MKFCQTDGTLLVADAPPADPYKTVVGNQSDIAAAIPPLDPFKTMVASPPPKAKEDVLQLPEEPDMLKTMVITPEELKKELKETNDVPSLDLPPPVPVVEPKAETPDDLPPAPPKPGELALSPPNFNDSPVLPKPSETSSTDATAVIDVKSPPENAPSPFDSKPFQNDFFAQSPYGNKENNAIPSPFDKSMMGYQPPPAPSVEAPKPPMVQEVEPPYSSGFQEPSNPSPFEPPSPLGQAEPFNQPLQQTEWTPPPAPVSEWGNQELGANTPFQPPGASQGQSQTLAIVSLALGLIGILAIIPTLIFTLCGIFPIALGLGAIITGFLARSRAQQKPDEYTGSGLAIGGMATGAISLLVPIAIIIIALLFIFGMFSFAAFS